MQPSNINILKRKRHEVGLDVRQKENEEHPSSIGSSEISNSTVEGEGVDLIVGLSDDVVLGEIIPRLSRKLPWDQRPLLSMLSRSWANAMAQDYPEYDRLYSPDAVLSPADFIVSRFQPFDPHDNSYPSDPISGRITMKVWNPFLGKASMLPAPPFRTNIFKKARYLCDGDCVYALIRPVSPVQQITVWVLCLRDFNVRWKILPPLLATGKHFFASTSSGERYIWQRRNLYSSEADGWKLIGSPENRNNFHWQLEYVNMRPPKNLNPDKFEGIPSFIEINTLTDKTLYIRYPIRQLGAFSTYQSRHYRALYRNYKPECIYLFPDLDRDDSMGGNQQPFVNGNLYNVARVNEATGWMCLLQAQVDNEKTRTVEDSEWDDFMEEWNLYLEQHRNGFILWDEGRILNQRGAIKFFMSEDVWRVQHRTELYGFVNVYNCRSSSFDVVHNGPIYAYVNLAASRFLG